VEESLGDLPLGLRLDLPAIFVFVEAVFVVRPGEIVGERHT
jgi:hypothetical protein